MLDIDQDEFRQNFGSIKIHIEKFISSVLSKIAALTVVQYINRFINNKPINSHNKLYIILYVMTK
jgi:hypothetical protein